VNLLQSLCSTNYLESITTLTPASPTDGPFIRVTAGARSSTYNDRVIFLTTKELIPQLEMRIGAEMKKLLEGYRANSACECYPWADTWPYSGGIADSGQNRGRFPSEPWPENWGSGSIPKLPTWVAANDWHNLFWYSVSQQNADQTKPGVVCRTCFSEMLTVDSAPVSALLFTPGTPPDGIPRLNPPAGQSARTNDPTLYLQDAQNNDAASSTYCPNVGEIGGVSGSGILSGTREFCDQYTKPTSKAFDRNRLYTVGTADPAVCATQSQAILNVSPCGDGFSGSSVNPICTSAAQNLDACPCKSAAKVMLKSPCRNTSNPPQCEAAIATLQQCGSW
jgi:hypothetical protein